VEGGRRVGEKPDERSADSWRQRRRKPETRDETRRYHLRIGAGRVAKCYRSSVSASLSRDELVVRFRALGLATAGVLVIVVAIGSVDARAADGSASWLRVDFADPDSCAGATNLAARIERRLGRSPEAAARSLEIAMVARIERRAESKGWAGEIDVVGPNKAKSGRRALQQDDASCEPLVDRLAFVAAMILDSAAATPAVRSPPAPQSTTATTAVASPQHVDTIQRRPTWILEAEGGAALAVGLLPGSAPGAEVSILAGPPGPIVAYVSAGYWTEERAAVGPNQGVALSLAVAGAGLCPARWRASHVMIEPCVGTDIGRLRARGFGLDNQTTSDRWAVDLTAGVELRWPTRRGLYLALGGRLVVPLVRDQIAYLDTFGQGRELFRMSPLAAVALIRLGYSRQ
jgi:hypothetical protein